MEEKSPSKIPVKPFLQHLYHNLLLGTAFIISALGIGMLGYHHFEKMDWIDAYVNAAMILSGMGPVSTLQTDSGKIFAGTYALFSGIIFLVIMALFLAPLARRFFRKLHLENRD